MDTQYRLGKDKLDKVSIGEDNISDSDEPETPKRKRFAPPTIDEVKEYCRERKNGVDAERFIDYYTSNGWLVGKNKMKDWKAAVRTWERNGYGNKKSVGTNGIPINNEPSELDGIF
jgi:hypothetical protein